MEDDLLEKITQEIIRYFRMDLNGTSKIILKCLVASAYEAGKQDIKKQIQNIE